MSDQIIQLKNLSDVEIVSSVNPTDTILLERDGIYKRALSTEVGSANIPDGTRIPNPHPIVINGQAYDGTAQLELGLMEKDAIQIDDSLTKTGFAADAKSAGDAIADLRTDKLSKHELPTVLPNPFPLYVNGVPYDGTNYLHVTIEDPPDVDSTLSIPGDAADAKATGTAIKSLEDDKLSKSELPSTMPNPQPITINGTEYDGSIKVDMTIETAIDKTLAVENAAADAKATGDAINNLSQSLLAETQRVDAFGLSVVDGCLCVTYEEEE